MTPPRILVAGIGNIFHGDDGFGVAVAQRLALRPGREGVRVVDYGIRGRDLAFDLLDGVDGLLLIDAAPRGGPPGSLHVLEPETGPPVEDAEMPSSPAQAHGLAPVEVFRLVRAMGGTLPPTLLIGCEPASIDPDSEGDMGLSEAVRRAVAEAVPLAEELIAGMIGEFEADGRA